MAPELIENNFKIKASDFWALGVLLHLICYRKYPFKRKNRKELFKNIVKGKIISEDKSKKIDPDLRAFILDLLIVNPEKRLG